MSLSEVMHFADTNVPVGGVILALATVYFGFTFVKKIVGGTIGFFGNLLAKFNYTMVSAALLAIGGMTGVGYGIGELKSGDPDPRTEEAIKPLTNDQITKLVTNKETNLEVLKQLMTYLKERDGIRPLSDDQVKMLATAKDINPEVLKLITTNRVQQQEAATTTLPSPYIGEKPIYRTAWPSLIGGIGMIIVSGFVFFVKINGYKA